VNDDDDDDDAAAAVDYSAELGQQPTATHSVNERRADVFVASLECMGR